MNEKQTSPIPKLIFNPDNCCKCFNNEYGLLDEDGWPTPINIEIYPKDPDKAVEYARYVVTAVNNHDGSVKALRECLLELKLRTVQPNFYDAMKTQGILDAAALVLAAVEGSKHG